MQRASSVPHSHSFKYRPTSPEVYRDGEGSPHPLAVPTDLLFTTVKGEPRDRGVSVLSGEHRGVMIHCRTLHARVDKEATKHYTALQKVYCVFDPTSPQPSELFARAASVVAVATFVLILISVVVFIVDSLPRYQKESSNTLFRIEAFCVSCFTLEFITRVVTCPSKRNFLRDPYNWIDFAAILPFYLELLASGDKGVSLVFLRVVRLARVFRMLKLGQYNKPLQMVILVLSHSIDALFLLVFLLFVCVVLFSSLMWLAEQSESTFDTRRKVWVRNDGLDSPFQSIPATFWWCMCTLTTVGYGDHAPVSDWGKVVASVCMIVGIFVLAFPVILISYNYSELAREMMLRELGYPPGAVQTFCPECGVPYQDQIQKFPRNPDQPSTDLRLMSTLASAVNVLSRGTSEELPTWGDIVCRMQKTPVGTVVTHWRGTESSRPLAVRYVGSYARALQFRYAPLLVPATTPDGELVVECRTNSSVGQHFLHLELVLDNARTSDAVAEAVRDCLQLDEQVPTDCYALPATCVTIRIPQLPPDCHLPVSTWYLPGNLLGINICADTAQSLANLAHRLPELTLHVSVTFTATPPRVVEGFVSTPTEELHLECKLPTTLECTVPLASVKCSSSPLSLGKSARSCQSGPGEHTMQR